ncbi:MAG: ROK family protein [Bacteroidetes bacterium]|nr:MAG: ROK family protein [Bacteroidota bacterium]
MSHTTAQIVLGIDVGASGIKGALVDVRQGTLVSERLRLLTPQPATPKSVTKVIVELVEKLEYEGDVVGCGFPAIIKKGVAWSAANISKKWIGQDVEALFSEATGKRFTVLNDADAAGIAEMQFGKGIGHEGTVILITIGSGLGSAVFTDGHLVRNTELGHFYLHGMPAEQYASNNARKRDGLSWKEWAKRFSEYLDHLDRLFSPDLVILGGGGSKKWDEFHKHLKTKLNVVPATLGNEAGIIGAAWCARPEIWRTTAVPPRARQQL